MTVHDETTRCTDPGASVTRATVKVVSAVIGADCPFDGMCHAAATTSAREARNPLLS